jgi:hypothetical protein
MAKSPDTPAKHAARRQVRGGFILFVSSLTVMYLACAMMAWSLNPGAWHVLIRCCAAVGFVVVVGVGFVGVLESTAIAEYAEEVRQAKDSE